MKRRSAVRFVMWSLAATVGCGGAAAGPGTAACSSAPASQLVLAVGAYTSIDPASDAGCVTIAANGSAVDSAEYLLLPQSASGTPGTSAPFRLQVVSLRPRWATCGRSRCAATLPARLRHSRPWGRGSRAWDGAYHRALQGPSDPAFTLSFSRDGSAPLPAQIAARLNVIRLR